MVYILFTIVYCTIVNIHKGCGTICGLLLQKKQYIR